MVSGGDAAARCDTNCFFKTYNLLAPNGALLTFLFLIKMRFLAIACR